MSDLTPREIAAVAEAEAKSAELAKVRAENATLRMNHAMARHHLALALRALNHDLPLEPATMPSTDRFGSGG